MGCDVYANNDEIACKAGSGKVIAAFPDVCLSPPSPPAGPVPIPYPNTSFSKDMQNGSKSVTIKGQEVMLKNQSFYKTSPLGDEAATNGLGASVITHVITGKTYFNAWSMDVQFEGQNVDRHLDLTTSNHACEPGSTPPMANIGEMAFAPGGVCEGMDHLRLQPYKKECPPNANGEPQTGHHLIPGRCMRENPDYNHDNAPVICVSRGNQHQGSHKRCHAKFDPVELDHFNKEKKFTYATARDTAAESAGGAMNPPRELSEGENKCVAHQLDEHYTKPPPKGPGCTSNTALTTSGAPGKVIPSTTPATAL